MPGEIYRHFKNKTYQIIAIATHSETGEPYVVYQALYGDFRTYIRPYDMFISEVDHEKYPEVTQKYRFECVEMHRDVQVEEQIQQGSQVEEQIQEDAQPQPASTNTDGVDNRLLEFLDTDDFNEKLRIVIAMERDLDNHLINQMAASIDVVIEDGDLSHRISDLETCIRVRARYEARR